MIFKPADILLPQNCEMEKWAVIACDQFTSQPEYWERVRGFVGEEPSTLHMIYPEAELSCFSKEKISKINEKMREYEPLLEEYKEAYVYVERTLLDGRVRKGVVGMIDLEAYDYSRNSQSLIRATERTVLERIPPRMEVRKNASLELSHVLLLCDDEKKQLIESVSERKEELPVLYDFELMEQGGHVKGWLLQGEEVLAFSKRLDTYMKDKDEACASAGVSPLYFAVGDGNHSLASAKANYERIKEEVQEDSQDNNSTKSLARYALVELGNIHEESLEFEPIHRLVKVDDKEHLLKQIEQKICQKNNMQSDDISHTVAWYTKEDSGNLFLDPEKGSLAVGILQEFLDQYLEVYGGEIDYIHGEGTLKELISEENTIGFVVPTIGKEELFMGVAKDGVLPRKTFSMGHAEEKRYYIETRKIVGE